MGTSRQTDADRFSIEIHHAPEGMTNAPDTVRSTTVKHDGNAVARFLCHTDHAEGIGKYIVNSLLDAAQASVFADLQKMEGLFSGNNEGADQDTPGK